MTNKKLTDIKGFLFDLDGTVYLGNKLLPGVRDFIDTVVFENIPYLFLTNNSSKSENDYVQKLNKLGINCSIKNILTSGTATKIYLSEQKINSIFLMGTQDLENDFTSNGFELCKINDSSSQAVVLGFDQTLTYDKIRWACHLIRHRVPFIATHPDILCPMYDGYWPDTGAMIEMFKAATGITPKIIGKPNPLLLELASMKLDIPIKSLAMVGDRLYTDIKMAVDSNSFSILVLTGETKNTECTNSDLIPDFIFETFVQLKEKYLTS